MYTLKDTFNNRVISRHRTIMAAVRADSRLARKIKRLFGNNSYLPTSILDNDGRPITTEHPEFDDLAHAQYEQA